MSSKYRMNRSRKSKIMRRRRILTYIVFIIIVTGILGGARKFYLDSKCKDLYYATQYYMTTYLFNDKKVLNVRSMDLQFSDGDSAIVKVKGAKPESNGQTVLYKAYFNKKDSSTWKLQNVTDDTEELTKNEN